MRKAPSNAARVVVLLPTRDAGWAMQAAEPRDGLIEGGRRTMHELAVAIACTGRGVEVRGGMSLPLLDELSEATGVRVELPSRPRHPDAADTVIVGEGIDDPRIYARLALSPARTVLMVLGPLGMFGWPFVEDLWSRPDYDSVDPASLSRAEHFAGAAALGFELWTHTPAFQRIAEASGERCELIGRAEPRPFPDPAITRDIDVLMLARSHWPKASARVEAALSSAGVRVTTLPTVGRADVLEGLGRARVFVHPGRAEAKSRVGAEARAMGSVPVVLRSNPFGDGADEASGVVPVGSVDEMAAAVTGLLAAPERLESLSARGMETARRESAWAPYVERVAKALEHPAANGAARAARAGIGTALRAERDRLEQELAAAHSDLARHRAWLEATNGSLSWRLTAPLRDVKRRARRR
jgi:hypothetical protein